MHVRFSTCRGLEVQSDSTHEFVGRLNDVLIVPDTGKIEGFFVRAVHIGGTPFLSAIDIVQWGGHVHVSDPEAIYPAEERIRLQSLLEDNRRIIGQVIRTEAGITIGRCMDVQFDTETMHCEWMFPRKWWRWQTPVPISHVIEVRSDAIIVREQEMPVREIVEQKSIGVPVELLKQVPDAG